MAVAVEALIVRCSLSVDSGECICVVHAGTLARSTGYCEPKRGSRPNTGLHHTSRGIPVGVVELLHGR